MATTFVSSNNEAPIIITPELYKAAAEGDGNGEYPQPLYLLVTLHNNTILHIHLIHPKLAKSIPFVREIVQKCPALLLCKNDNGDTPMHIAARYGLSEVVKELLQLAKLLPDKDLERGMVPAGRLLEIKNNKSDLALHEAARNGHIDVAKLLLQQSHDVEYGSNDSGETPLYIAASKGYKEIVVEILDSSKAVAYRGPCGKTAFHAAVMNGHQDTASAIIDHKVDWAKETDEYGWTPLHYCAHQFFWSVEFFKMIMEYDRWAIYVGDKARKRTPLHIAACIGHFKIMEEMICKFPDCCEMVDIKGWNVAHYVVAGKSEDALNIILENSPLIYLMNVKDVKGHTPLHLLVASSGFRFPSNFRIWQTERCWEVLTPSTISTKFSVNGPAEKEILEWMEDLGEGPLGNFSVGKEWVHLGQDVSEEEESPALERTKDSHLLVATLVATVSFAAGFTLPGGFKGDKDDTDRGSAILSKNSAFQAFVVADTIAMLLSTISVFIHFLLPLYGFKQKFETFMELASYTIMGAIMAMAVAFVTGLYAVLAPSHALAITTCVIGVSFFFFVFRIICKMIKREVRLQW